MALLGRSKATILIDKWDLVPKEVKNKIWQTIMLTYDVPNNNLLRSKWISYVGQRWRGFKSDLTSRYIYGKLSHKNPCEIYQFLDEQTWQAFQNKRLEHVFQEKRKFAQDLQKNNLHLHKLLEEIMIREASSLATDDRSDLSLISPPARHEKWKRARTKPSGEYTSEETRLVAEKIDDLVEKSSQGSFTQKGRDDILAVAIGRLEHPGYIRGVRRGVGLKQFFGGPTRNESDKEMLRNEFKKKMFPELRDELLSEVKSEIASLGLAIQGAPKGASHVASTKGSCPEESGDGVNVPIDCELYVDDPHWHLVALGKIYNLGSTIHHEAIKDDMLRVVVVDIKDSPACVPLPSEEDVSKKTNIVTTPQPQLSPVQQLGAMVVTNKTIEIDMPPELTCKTATTTLFVCHRDICEIVIGNDLLYTTVLQLWNLYLYHLCIERRNTTIYGFLDPVIIQSVGNKSEEVQKYLIEMFEKAVIVPDRSLVVLLCSLHKKANTLSIKNILEASLEAHSRLRGVPYVSRKKMQIITPNILIISAGLKTGKLLRQSTRTLVPHTFIDFSSRHLSTKAKSLFSVTWRQL
ncbi:hypothetical protein V8G54_002012 [Vigna mungo]|uniref:Uncharacterized protein n=1 Tax=Vigna mungo TaxID=3915 RepID=A0AAQ3PBG8_VIGMU